MMRLRAILTVGSILAARPGWRGLEICKGKTHGCINIFGCSLIIFAVKLNVDREMFSVEGRHLYYMFTRIVFSYS